MVTSGGSASSAETEKFQADRKASLCPGELFVDTPSTSKRLGGLTPHEVFCQKTGVALVFLNIGVSQFFCVG